ncbi:MULTISPECIES: hypothetical protein [Bosea]|uniref:hypothetical protein n=1 Tax=Bosea TaxID=85413 RepID=UPI0021506591|nr:MULTISPECIES: hypothetical protein [Bosea]MCR4520009.1 hypothetical protein [Bosea sp. 47.2.35]MDR6828745.1 hypothetical protein [Bosea robiniae]MDR6895841.1 hypothetical protein [Bosea sp. BE109]MDR7139237.1 hypothetical protein [Bosea sp. BE168]MDR7175725.1 hypothetical protein [Bosea sp. BE271]
MTAIGTYRRRREAVYRSVPRTSAGGLKADLLHLCGSIVLLAVLIGARVWWHMN